MTPPRPFSWRPILAAAASATLFGTLVVCAQPAPPPSGHDAAPSTAIPADIAAPATTKPQSSTVRIVFTVLPSTKKAMVFWGKKKLGPIAPHQPLVVQRPRDSGPLDVIVRSDGCVPVQTRAYTFADNKIAVKLTPLDQKSTLLGYREELPPDGGAPANPDGGAPP
jgi:hypothetical protein